MGSILIPFWSHFTCSRHPFGLPGSPRGSILNPFWVHFTGSRPPFGLPGSPPEHYKVPLGGRVFPGRVQWAKSWFVGPPLGSNFGVIFDQFFDEISFDICLHCLEQFSTHFESILVAKMDPKSIKNRFQIQSKLQSDFGVVFEAFMINFRNILPPWILKNGVFV